MGKKGKKKGKSKDVPIGMPYDTDEKLADVALVSETLEADLAGRSALCESAVQKQLGLRDDVQQREENFKQEQLTTYAVTADMARQYKALQEDLIHKINSLETTLTEQREELDVTDHELKELIRDKDEEIAAKENTITELKSRMEEMAVEFADMLKTTLSLMQEKMAAKLTPDQDKEAAQQNYAHRLQEFSVRSSTTAKVET